jgi:hypothetical protein
MSVRAVFPPVNRTKGDPLSPRTRHPNGRGSRLTPFRAKAHLDIKKLCMEAPPAGKGSKDTPNDDLIGGRDDR